MQRGSVLIKGAIQVVEWFCPRDVGLGALFRSTEISYAARSQPAEQRMLVGFPLDLALRHRRQGEVPLLSAPPIGLRLSLVGPPHRGHLPTTLAIV